MIIDLICSEQAVYVSMRVCDYAVDLYLSLTQLTYLIQDVRLSVCSLPFSEQASSFVLMNNFR